MHATYAGRTVAIDGMVDSACVQTVKSVLSAVQGVSTVSVALGTATIYADPQGSDAACRAIDNAGYQAHESKYVSEPSPVQRAIGSTELPSASATTPPSDPSLDLTVRPRSKYTNSQRTTAPDHAR
jgi:copper chaperone CopZ